jgi:hypothetical protein
VDTALDTNGYLGDRPTDAELDKIDLVLSDIKTWDPSGTGVSLLIMIPAVCYFHLFRHYAVKRKPWVLARHTIAARLQPSPNVDLRIILGPPIPRQNLAFLTGHRQCPPSATLTDCPTKWDL